MGIRPSGIDLVNKYGRGFLMVDTSLRLVPVVLGMATSLVLIWRVNWRWTIAALVVQYLSVLLMVAQSWPLGLSLVKLVVGLVSSGILASSLVVHVDQKSEIDRAGRILSSLVVLFIWLIVFYSTPIIRSWLRIDQEILWGGLIMFGSGLIQLGMTIHPVRVAIGLLSFLAGFEVIYSALELSVLVAGLQAVIDLGTALVGAYLAALPEQAASK